MGYRKNPDFFLIELPIVLPIVLPIAYWHVPAYWLSRKHKPQTFSLPVLAKRNTGRQADRDLRLSETWDNNCLLNCLYTYIYYIHIYICIYNIYIYSIFVLPIVLPTVLPPVLPIGLPIGYWLLACSGLLAFSEAQPAYFLGSTTRRLSCMGPSQQAWLAVIPNRNNTVLLFHTGITRCCYSTPE